MFTSTFDSRGCLCVTRLFVVHTFMCTLTRLLPLIITITTDFIVIITIAAVAIGTRLLKYFSQGQQHREATKR